MDNYSVILKKAIDESGLKLSNICEMVGQITGTKPSIAYLSRLQNGKNPPAGDKINDALATVLKIDVIELKAAAYREKISPEILRKLAANCNPV